MTMPPALHASGFARNEVWVCLWYDEGEKKGIRFVTLEMEA